MIRVGTRAAASLPADPCHLIIARSPVAVTFVPRGDSGPCAVFRGKHEEVERDTGACAMLIGGMAGAQVQDMPGGPKVNQLNLHEGVTQIARDVMWLHWMLLTICIVIFIGVFGVMFYSIWAHRKSAATRPPPSTSTSAWKSPGPSFPSSSSLRWPAGHQDGGRHERHIQRRPDRQGHRLSMEMGLRVPRRLRCRRQVSPRCRRRAPRSRTASPRASST